MRAATKSYGILLPTGSFEWLIKKGDLVFSNKAEIIESSSFWKHPGQNQVRGKHDFRVFCYNGDGDDYDHDLPDNWRAGQHGR